MVMVAKVVGGREGNDERIILPPTAGDEMAAVLSPAIQLMPEKPERLITAGCSNGKVLGRIRPESAAAAPDRSTS